MIYMTRTRFAPSPTGYVHIGNLRTTLFEYLFAKHTGGTFVVRVEDTDQERLVPGAVESMLKTLAWVGIVPDEGPTLDSAGNLTEKGNYGPYVQSQRLDIYKKYADELLNNGHAYYAFDTTEELTAMRDRQQARKLATKYDRAQMRNQYTLSAEEVTALLASNTPRVIRLKVPDSGEVVFEDAVHGRTVFDVKEIDDQVLLKSDGFPTYHLAVVVDDHLMEITHIIRGDDWISSTPKHLLLYKAFGWTPPIHAHVPLVVGSDKLKLSKRKGDVSTESYRAKGYMPEALVNFLAFLGWNPGTEKELYTMEELIKDFTLEKVSKASAVFNVDKLNWFNKEYIKKLSPGEFLEVARPWLSIDRDLSLNARDDRGGDKRDEKRDNNARHLVQNDAWLEKAVGLEKERITVLSELPEAIQFVFQLPDYTKEMLLWRKGTLEEVQKILPEVKTFLENVAAGDWNKTSLEEKIKAWIAEKGHTTGSVLWPLRVALSGQENSPGPFEIGEVFGKDECLRRVQVAVEKIG